MRMMSIHSCGEIDIQYVVLCKVRLGTANESLDCFICFANFLIRVVLSFFYVMQSRRIIGWLQRRGHNWDTVKFVLDEIDKA